ncbi:MAG: hypothetical protein ACREJM_16445, partial [Candidatus Saccharimonadales bacterium]
MSGESDKGKEKAKTYSVSSTDRPGRRSSFEVPSVKLPSREAAKRRLQGRAGTLILVAVVAVISGFGGGWLESHGQGGVVGGSLSGQKRIITTQSQLISQIAKTVGPSVVSVNVNI